MKWIVENWQRALFAIIGFVFLFFSIRFVTNEKVPEASGIFAISFLCFLYSNLSRFRKFKGLGFEAELWEDKQKEAEYLIDRLKNIVSIYTTQTIMNGVTRMRLGNGADWTANWKLYDDLVGQHESLGQRIDFSDLKKKVDDYFLFDICTNESSIREKIIQAKSTAREMIEKEFGKVVSDEDGYSKRIDQLQQIDERFENQFEVSQRGNLAREMLKWADSAKAKAREYFDIQIDFDRAEIEKLEFTSRLYDSRPVRITDELIELTKRGKRNSAR